jgi:opacity protein-like surface antigen
LTLGLGVTLGYVDVEDNPNQTFEQFLGRVIYEVAEKLSLNASFGGELRQYQGGVGDTFSPVWTVAGVYRVREGTALTLQANQQYRSSAHFGNQSYLRTGLRASVAQRVYRRVELTVSGLYYHSDYESTVSGVSSDRTDDSFLVSVGLNTQLWERWLVGVFYDYQDNQSTVPDFDYDRHRVGVRAAWTY